MDFKLIVAGRIESDVDGIAPTTLLAAAVEAVGNELRHGEDIGFSHSLEDNASISISSVQPITPTPAEYTIPLGNGRNILVRTTEEGGAYVASSGLRQQGRGSHNAAIDNMEATLLALAAEGFDLSTDAAKRAITNALAAIESVAP